MRWPLAPGSPLVIANPDPVPAVIGALMEGLLALLVLSPSGRYPGRDLNPRTAVPMSPVRAGTCRPVSLREGLSGRAEAGVVDGHGGASVT